MQPTNDRRSAPDRERDHGGPRQTNPANGEGTRPGGLTCASCGADVPEGARSCPVCHRGVYRTCFCGWQLPATEAACPNCGADWSQSARVARKTKSSSARTRNVLRYAGLGALSAIVVALVVQVVLNGLASVATGDQDTIPTGLWERLDLALGGIAELLSRAGAFFVRHGGTILLILGIMLVGALAGVGAYMLQRGSAGHHTSRTSRRVRRKRRK